MRTNVVSLASGLREHVQLTSSYFITILHNKHQDLYVFDLETSNGALLPALQRAYVLTGNGPSSCSTIGRLERVRSQQTPATNIMEGTTVCLCGCTSTLTLQQHIIHHRYTFGSLQKQQQQMPHSCGTRMLRSLAVTPCQAHTEANLNTQSLHITQDKA